MAITQEQAKENLKKLGLTVKQWADIHGFTKNTTNDVLYRSVPANRGAAHRCAILLGIKDGTIVFDDGKAVNYRDGQPIRGRPRRIFNRQKRKSGSTQH